MPVEYESYRIFYFVAKYGSFTRAAAALRSHQPNVTRTMNRLEYELGCRLFLRSNRGIRLTPEGERLYAHVQIAQSQLEAAEEELEGKRTLQSGTVCIGASETALHGLLLPKLRDFCGQYPGIRIRLSNCSTPQAVAALQSGAAELALVTTPAQAPRPLRETRLKEVREILIAGPRFSGLADRTLSLSELESYPLVCLGRGTGTYAFYDRLFARCGLVLRPDVEAATADQILPLVQNDLGLGFLPEEFAMEALEKKAVFRVRLREEIPPRHICLLRDAGRPLSAAARELERVLCLPEK